MADKSIQYNPIVQSERLYLREVRPSDVNETYYRWMNDPEITRYLETRFIPQSIENIRDYVISMQGDADNCFFAILLREKDRHMGNIKLGPIRWTHRLGEISLIIGEKECWGKGYATEVIELIVQHAFETLNLHKVTAGCYSTNTGSIKAFQKAGFEIEGKRKDHFYDRGTYVDHILFGRINSDAV